VVHDYRPIRLLHPLSQAFLSALFAQHEGAADVQRMMQLRGNFFRGNFFSSFSAGDKGHTTSGGLSTVIVGGM
jgi:hypothetical protein